jgi:nicotinate-nucleotide adenylyltransferase
MKTIESFREKYGADITVLEMAPVDDSSTQVRNLVKEGKSITGLVPPGVEEYIIEHKLYK